MTEKKETKNNPETKPKENSSNFLGGEMSFLEHLDELRKRILIVIITVAAAFVILYAFLDRKLVQFFMMPMAKAIEGKGKFQFTSPAEGFIFDLKISFIAALFASSPMVFYQLWKFLAPALYKKEKSMILPFIFFSTALFATGAGFGYWIVFPKAFHFFATYSFSGVEINPKLADYFTFATKMLLAFGLVFEFPLIAVFAARIGLINAKFMNRNRKYAIPIIFTVAAFLTPSPDVISQLLLAFPLWFLYELSVVLVWFLERRDKEDPAG